MGDLRCAQPRGHGHAGVGAPLPPEHDVIQAVRTPYDRRPRALVHADRLAAAVELDMAAHWAPTVDGYLGRVTKARILEAVREGVSDEAAKRVAGLKKQAMAEAAEQLQAGTGWLPTDLRAPRGEAEDQASAAE